MQFRPFLGLALPAVLLLAPSVRAASETEVDVVVDMTPAGRKVAHPSPGHPAYFLPVVGGYQAQGETMSGEKPPSQYEVLHVLAMEMGKQGYLDSNPAPYVNKEGQFTYADGTVVTVPDRPRRREAFVLNPPDGIPLTMAMVNDPDGPYAVRPRPSATPGESPSLLPRVLKAVDPVHGPTLKGMPNLIMVVYWGYMNPVVVDTAGDQKVFLNENRMLALVGGNVLKTVDIDFANRERIAEAAEEDRYFIMVSAYDFETYAQTRKKVLLWQAKMSVPSRRVNFEQVLGALVHVGGPMFGRDMDKPQMVTAPIAPDGRVEIGPLTVKDYQNAPTPPAAPQPKNNQPP